MSPPDLIQQDISLKEHNWWRVGGSAQYFSAPTNLEDLQSTMKWWLSKDLPLWILGGGSNVLIQDGVVQGLVLSTHQLRGMEVEEKDGLVRISSLAGTPKSDVARIFLKNKLAPAVFLTGIPGDMAGGVVMNAGLGDNYKPREFCEITKEIEVFQFNKELQTISVHTFSSEDINWQYRHSSGWQPGIITRVVVEWENKPDPEVLQMVKQQTKKRVSTQPLDLPSCGSTFRNPHGGKAAQMIEQCGLKGFRIGGAQVSLKHANFIINDQNASAMDVHNIILHVRNVVEQRLGVRLQPEVVYLGHWT